MAPAETNWRREVVFSNLNLQVNHPPFIDRRCVFDQLIVGRVKNRQHDEQKSQSGKHKAAREEAGRLLEVNELVEILVERALFQRWMSGAYRSVLRISETPMQIYPLASNVCPDLLSFF